MNITTSIYVEVSAIFFIASSLIIQLSDLKNTMLFSHLLLDQLKSFTQDLISLYCCENTLTCGQKTNQMVAYFSNQTSSTSY